MPKTIHKIEVTGEPIFLPKDAEILYTDFQITIHPQNGGEPKLYMWVLFDSGQVTFVSRLFVAYPTGREDIPDDAKYINSATTSYYGGPFVLHTFELPQ